MEAKKILDINNTINFIGGLSHPKFLNNNDIEIIDLITKSGICHYSNVLKDNTRIKVISGPLKEIEGKIIKVDRRNQKAMVELPLLNSIVKVSLGFEYINSIDQ
jgi:transcription antitermination factor NusG